MNSVNMINSNQHIMSNFLLVLFLVSHFGWYVDAAERAELAKRVKSLKSALDEAVVKLIKFEEEKRVLLYPRSCMDIRKLCPGALKSGTYAVYDSKQTTQLSIGFMMKPDHVECEFEGPAGGQSQCTDLLPGHADPRYLYLYTDCTDIQTSFQGMAVDGVYTIYNTKWSKKTKNGFKLKPKKVYCNMEVAGGGWTVIQRRMDGAVDFYANWEKYATGFGDLAGDHWIGNRALHAITQEKDYILRVEMETESGEKLLSTYQNFKVGSEKNLFALTLDVEGEFGYLGTTDDLLSYQNGMSFSTWDSDNSYATFNCAKAYASGWWFKSCTYSNLNGVFGHSEHQTIWWGKMDRRLSKVVMMIRPRLIEK